MALHALGRAVYQRQIRQRSHLLFRLSAKVRVLQNMEISRGCKGVDLTEDQLIAGMQRLIDAGAQNINLVSPTQYAPALARLLRRWKPRLRWCTIPAAMSD